MSPNTSSASPEHQHDNMGSEICNKRQRQSNVECSHVFVQPGSWSSTRDEESMHEGDPEIFFFTLLQPVVSNSFPIKPQKNQKWPGLKINLS